MHAAHVAAQAAHQRASSFAEMQERGAGLMGFNQEKTTHHFVLADDGGRIEVQANSADRENIAAIRKHLQQIAKAFAEGDFSIPTQVHDQPPPGAAEMQRLKAEIFYGYQELPAGGAVVISSKSSEAIVAIHRFLRFQITEHRTGDPSELKH
jgi:hypothetical protein